MRRDRPAPIKPSAEIDLDKDKLLAEFRNTRWYKRGEQIVERVRKGYSGGGSSASPRAYSPGRVVEKVVEAIPKYARKIGGIGVPPDAPQVLAVAKEAVKYARKIRDEGVLGKRRKPGEWGGAGR